MITNYEEEARRIVRKFAELKNIPVGKVLRNMARDFAQAAERTTPLAKKSRSEFYWYKGKDGQKHYLHESIVDKVLDVSYTKTGKRRVTRLKTPLQKKLGRLRKVKIAKGWSKAVWITPMRELGMTAKKPRPGVPPAVLGYGQALISQLESATPEIDLTAQIHFDALTGTEQQIINAGWALARQRFIKEYGRIMRWGRK